MRSSVMRSAQASRRCEPDDERRHRGRRRKESTRAGLDLPIALFHYNMRLIKPAIRQILDDAYNNLTFKLFLYFALFAARAS